MRKIIFSSCIALSLSPLHWPAVCGISVVKTTQLMFSSENGYRDNYCQDSSSVRRATITPRGPGFSYWFLSFHLSLILYCYYVKSNVIIHTRQVYGCEIAKGQYRLPNT